MTNSKTLEQRLERLEAIEAIRRLKARYFAACDAKDMDVMRDCFAAGTVHIDYGMIGTFDSREGLIQIFEQLGNHPHIIDLHHGQNADIDITGPDTATANWGLYFYQIDTQTQKVTQLGGTYADEYTKTDQGWVIQRTVFTVISSVILQLDESQVSTLFAGKTPA